MDSKHKVINLPGEEWRDVVGFEGRYMVSNYGRVKSLPNQTRSDERILKEHVVRNIRKMEEVLENFRIN